MTEQEIMDIAKHLYDAEKNRKDIDKITNTKALELTVAEAYQIQNQLIQLRLADGHDIYAPKLGLTSPAKMEQMNVDHPIYGYVFSDMLVENNGSVSLDDYIHARVEPEIAVVLKDELKGPNVTISDVKDRIAYVVSSMEILDSRYQNYNFTLPDVIADNTSAKGAVYSKEEVKQNQVDFTNEEAVLKINGEVKAEGVGSAVLGHPLESIVFLTKALNEKEQAVPAGVPIMTGGMTASVPVQEDDLIEIDYTTLGNISVKVKK